MLNAMPGTPSDTRSTWGEPPVAGGVASEVQVPGYEVIEELGRGGMGVVYRAKHLRLERFVALKRLGVDARSDADALLRFHREARAFARLDHPNIVRIYDLLEHNHRFYLCLELCHGGSLAYKVWGADAKPVSMALAVELIVTLADAIQTAHDHGVIHRDVKPGNVLLSGEPNAPLERQVPKLTDFGLVRIRGETMMTRKGAILGTPRYMAPEQATGKVDLVCPATDVYALGAILFELLSGKPTFYGEADWEILRQVVEDLPAFPEDARARIPKKLQELCLQCMQKDPRDRIQTASELIKALAPFASGKGPWRSALGMNQEPAGPETIGAQHVAPTLRRFLQLTVQASRAKQYRQMPVLVEKYLGAILKELEIEPSDLEPAPAGDSQAKSVEVGTPGAWLVQGMGSTEETEWQRVCTTPAYVEVQRGRIYRFSVATTASDSDLAELISMRAVSEMASLSLTGCDQITDLGIRYLGVLTQLRSLSLWGCDKITDHGLAFVGRLLKLRSLNLAWCGRITDEGVLHLAKLARLCSLNLGKCRLLTDRGINRLSVFKSLLALSVEECELVTDRALVCLARMTQLRALVLEKCDRITDRGVLQLSRLTKLQALDLAGCRNVTDAGIEQLRQALPKCQISR